MLFSAFYGLDNSEIHQSSNETMDSVKGHLIQSLSYVRQHCSKCTKASRPLLCLPGSTQTESDVTCVVLDQSVRCRLELGLCLHEPGYSQRESGCLDLSRT